MNDKLKELTEKIYNEGIEKAEKEAAEIISNAKKEAEDLLKKSKLDAEQIVENAKKEAQDLRRNVESEIKLSARQAINALKQNITDLILAKFSEEETKNALQDKDFIKKIIEKIIENFSKDSGGIDFNIILSDRDKNELEAYFNAKQKSLFDKGLEIKFSDKIQSGFEIGSKDNSYKISFTDETFEAFFRNYLRQRSINLLYQE